MSEDSPTAKSANGPDAGTPESPTPDVSPDASRPSAAAAEQPEAAAPRLEAAPVPDAKERARNRRAIPVLAALGGVAALALTAVVVVYGTAVPATPAAKSGSVSPVALPAGETVATCPGPARLLAGADAGTDPQFNPVSKDSTATVNSILLNGANGVIPGATLNPVGQGSPLNTLSPVPDAASANATAKPGAAPTKAIVSAGQGVSDQSVLRSNPVAGKPSAVNSIMSFTAKDGDLQGLAATNCQTPSNDIWLNGASTAVGRTGILVMTNASATSATVDLALYGDKGRIQAPGSQGLLIAPGTSRSVVLAGLASDATNLSVHVTSSGGPVSAVIQQSVLRGLVPGGVELIQPVSAPSTRAVITGVTTQNPAQAASLAANSGFQDASTALDVTVPGSSDAVMQVQVYGTGGQVSLPSGGVFTAKAGSVTELPLTGLPAGAYTIDVHAEASFTANVRVVTGTDHTKPIDFASAPASQPLSSGQLMVLPANANSSLVLGVPSGHAKVSLTPVAPDGSLKEAKTVDVSAATTVQVSPTQIAGGPVAGFIISSTGDPVYGAQLMTGIGLTGISVASIPDGVAAAQSVKVQVSY